MTTARYNPSHRADTLAALERIENAEERPSETAGQWIDRLTRLQKDVDATLKDANRAIEKAANTVGIPQGFHLIPVPWSLTLASGIENRWALKPGGWCVAEGSGSGQRLIGRITPTEHGSGRFRARAIARDAERAHYASIVAAATALIAKHAVASTLDTPA